MRFLRAPTVSIASIIAGPANRFPIASGRQFGPEDAGCPWRQLGYNESPTLSALQRRREAVGYMLAVTEWRNGHLDAALNRLRPIVAASPKNTEAQMAFADLAVLAGAPDAAEYVDRAIAAGFGGAIGFYSPDTPHLHHVPATAGVAAPDAARRRVS